MNNRFSTSVRFFTSLLLLVVSIAGGAFAQRPVDHWQPRIESRKAEGVGEVIINGAVALRFRAKRGGLLPFERAQLASVRLTEAVAAGEGASSVRIGSKDPDAPELLIAGRHLLTVPVTDVPKAKSRRRRRRLLAAARANALAEVESAARSVRRMLALPGLILSESGKVIPLEEKRTIVLQGAARGDVHVTTQRGESSVVSWQVDPAGNAITFSGLKHGRETIFIEREGAVATFYTAVKPYAGQVQSPPGVMVTGSIAPASLIERLVRVAALTAVNLTPGASKRISAEALRVPAIRAGQTGLVGVPVRLWGPDMLPVETKVFVPIVNTRLAVAPTTTLLYSNNPERVIGPGNLFVGRLAEVNQITRVLYHHQNNASSLLHFRVELVNDSDSAAQVQTVGGDAGPERDTVWVGFRAAADYISASESGVGAVLTIPPHSYIGLSSLKMPRGQTVSGLMQLRTLSGSSPLIRIFAERTAGSLSPIYEPLPLDTVRQELSDPVNFSEHVYANPTQTLQADYRVGGPWTFIKYGRVGLTASASPQTVLHGNYGVFYDIQIELSNPTDASAKVRLVFEPSAGMAGGIFLFGGRRIEIPQSDMMEETTLSSITLRAGEKRTVKIRTVPLSGSNYPATIIVRP